MHPDDAAARGLADGRRRARLQRPRRLPRGLRSSTPTCCPGVVQMSTGAWFSPVTRRGARAVRRGNVNVLTPDVGSSRLSQGCTGSRALVEIEGWRGDPPAIAASAPPEIVDGG